MNVLKSNLLIVLFLFASCAKLERIGIKANKYPHQKQSDIFRMVWAKNLDPQYITGNLPIGYGTPLIHESKVFITDLSGKLNVYDLNSGRVIKTFDEKKPLSGKLGVYQNKLFYSSISGRVYVRDLATYNLEYAIDLKAPVETCPLFHQGRAIYHLRNHQIMALDAISGKILWSYKRAIPFSTTLQRVSVPVAVGNKLYVGFADGYVGGFSLEEGILEWETKISMGNKFVDVDVTPIYFNGRIVVSSANGDLKFLSPQNGGQMISIAATPGHTPKIEENKLVFGTVDGRLLIVNSNGSIILDKKISENGISALSLWKNGYVAAGYDGNLYFISKFGLKIEDKWDLGTSFSTVFGELTVDKGNLAVYSSRNRLYVFR